MGGGWRTADGWSVETVCIWQLRPSSRTDTSFRQGPRRGRGPGPSRLWAEMGWTGLYYWAVLFSSRYSAYGKP